MSLFTAEQAEVAEKTEKRRKFFSAISACSAVDLVIDFYRFNLRSKPANRGSERRLSHSTRTFIQGVQVSFSL